ALIKNGPEKQVWVDGELLLDQPSGAAPLLTDWTALVVGHAATEPEFALHGWVDDLAVFGVALKEDQIQALAQGQSPLSLAQPIEIRPPRITPVSPEPDARSLDLNTPIELRIATQEPNEIARDRIRILVNGTDETENAVVEGSQQDLTVRLSYPLESNQTYTVSIAVADQEGRESSIAWSFDTIENQNIALNARAYMMRFNEGLPPTSNGNDGNVNTHTESTPRAVGSYWETDLERVHAISEVRVIVPRAFRSRMSHATVRLYDGDHQSVFSEHLSRGSGTWEIAVPPDIHARYVRVGYENKERSESGTFWYLGLSELEVYGRPATEVGILDFQADRQEIESGEGVTLAWQGEQLNQLELYPGSLLPSLVPGERPEQMGALNLAPTASTEYLLLSSTPAPNHTRFVTVTVNGESLQPTISEFVAMNRLSLRDSRSQSPDWIEVHNPRDTPLNISGYSLSDDEADLTKWSFPQETVIEPHGFLVVFGSNGDGNNEEGDDIYTSFNLNGMGESLFLTGPDGSSILDSFENYPAQTEDLAYGRNLDGKWTFVQPTPRQINEGVTFEGWLNPVEFSHHRGFYQDDFTLELTHPNDSATLRVSLDGSEPSSEHNGSVNINSTKTVRVRVERPGYYSPRTQTHSYFFLEDVLSASNMNQTIIRDRRYRNRLMQGLTDLPTISVNIPELPDDWDEREASVEVFLPHSQESIQANAGVKRFGGAWTNFDKKNYRLKFRPEYGARKLNFPLFKGFENGFLTADAFDEIDLRGGGHDMNSRGFYMSARFAEDTMLEMGSLNPHGRFVHVYFNGEYWGQYHARERLTDAFLADYLGGPSEDYVNIRGNDNAGSSFVPGTPDPVNREPWEFVLANRGSYERIKDWIDMPHFIDFMLMWNYGNAETEYRAAGPIVPGSGFKFWLGDADGHIRLPGDRTGNSGPAGLLGALRQERHPEFMALFADRAHQHLFNDGVLTTSRSVERLQRRLDEVENSILVESARWGYRSPSSWQSAAQNALSDILPSQGRNLISRLRSRGLYPSVDAPILSQHGGVFDPSHPITLQSSAQEIYYTLDGTDPRQTDGSVASSALSWSGTGMTVIPFNTTWRYWDRGTLPDPNWTSRTYQDNQWPEGRAPLGYGDGGMATVLSFGPSDSNKHATSYFRRTFDVDDPADVGELIAELVRDDGAVVYLNGTEIIRDGLPQGPVTNNTLANATAGGDDESAVRAYPVPGALLVRGRNVIAAEVHQTSRTSSDTRFNFALKGSSAVELKITEPVTFKARARSGTTWSALSVAHFVETPARRPEIGELLISEIHYNSDGGDEYEFIELYNATDSVLDLSHLKFIEGVEFLFPERSFLNPNSVGLVVENIDRFNQRYSDPMSDHFFPDLTIYGQWSGQLSNGGETIQILNDKGENQFSVTYDNNLPWPEAADGEGSSLELISPELDSADPSSWWSVTPNGTPGRAFEIDVVPSFGLQILFSEDSTVLLLEFIVEQGRSYEIQFTNNLSLGEWAMFDTVLDAAEGLVSVPLSSELDGERFFFRILRLP
ncbi:lamin tail domain-containing protein, partial [bacterium]|nr:lamin tail domain-containing protein [bacterium]